jgi:2-methylcitrate dehydratase PrpD
MIKLTETLAEFVYRTSLKDIPNQAVDIAHEHVLDCIGVTMAGSADSTGRIITHFVKEMGGEPKASVFCGGFKTSAPQAALANGTMAHALDYDDDYSDFTVLHPSAVVLPATLAMGEVSGASGEDLLEAYILGIEIAIVVGSILNMEDVNKGWHATSTLGTLGAAAASAKILKLDTEKIRIAMGIAASSSCGLRQNFGTMTKPFHAGRAAASGVMAAMLADRNFTADKGILESPFGFLNLFSNEGTWESQIPMVKQLGDPFKMFSPGVYIKQCPCCAGTLSSIDAILHLTDKYQIDPETVESVQCLVHPLNVGMLSNSKPKTSLQGKFSMAFCLAIALLEKRVGLEQFTDEKVLDPKTQELMKRIEMDVNPAMKGKDYKPGSFVKIRIRDGLEYSHTVDTPEGSPKSRLSREKLMTKFENCCKKVISNSKTTQIEETITNLRITEDIEMLLDLIR